MKPMRGTSSPSLHLDLDRRGPNRIAMWCAMTMRAAMSLILITSSRKFAFAQDADEYTTGGGILRARSVHTNTTFTSSRFLEDVKVSKEEAEVRLELARTEQIVLTDAYARQVARIREDNNDEFLKIQHDYLSAVPVAHDPSDSKYNPLYDALFEELTNKNEKAKEEIISEQAALSEVLVQLEGELLELANALDPEEDGNDLTRASLEATRNELNDEIESLMGSLKGPICCILDNLRDFIDDPMRNEKFSRTLEATFNEVMLQLDLDSIMVPNSTRVTHQDWLDEIHFGSEDFQARRLNNDNGNGKRRQKQRRRRRQGRKLAVMLETEYTCGSLCLQTCDEKKIEALGADGIGHYCLPHSVSIQQDIVDKLNFQTQSLFTNELSDLVEVFNDTLGKQEGIQRRATISCAACGEWSVDQGYGNYVNPDILREVHGYATAMNKLVDQEKMRMKEFDVALDQAISLYRERKDNTAMLFSVCIGDVNEKYTRGRRKLVAKVTKGVTPRPTKMPTPRPITRRPTPRPTWRPRPRPTIRPTQKPTWRPRPRPTIRPTPIMPRPTIRPSPIMPRPTIRPTPRPITPRPTKMPTPIPVITPRPTPRPVTIQHAPIMRPTRIPTQRPTIGLELLNNDQAIDFTVWELDLMICSDANEAAINTINLEYMDTTEKAQFNLDVQLQELAEKHEIILNGMGDYVSKLSVLVEEPLIREMETKRELEISTRERILERRANMAMEVSNSITCEIHGVQVEKDLTDIEIGQFEDLFVEAMDASFRNAEIDLIMEDFVIEKECVLSKYKEDLCRTIDNGDKRKLVKSIHRRTLLRQFILSERDSTYTSRFLYVRARSRMRCALCHPRTIQGDYSNSRPDRRKLMSNLAIALSELTDHMDMTEWEKSDEIRDLIVKDVNEQLTKYLKSAWRRRVTSKKDFSVACYIDEA